VARFGAASLPGLATLTADGRVDALTTTALAGAGSITATAAVIGSNDGSPVTNPRGTLTVTRSRATLTTAHAQATLTTPTSRGTLT
jgi:hypothetical protein